MSMKSLNILILSGSPQTQLVETCLKRGHIPVVKDPTEFNIYLSDKTRGYDALYYDETDRVKAKDFDAVISRVGRNRDYASKVIDHFRKNLGIFCVQSGDAINTCSDKVKTAQIMSQRKIRVPKQVYAINPKNIAFIIKKLDGLPIILKEVSNSKGKGIILLESPLQTNMTLESYYGSDKRIILQEFIDNGGTDERHIVCDGEVVCSMERLAPKTDIRANVSLQGSGRKIEADEETTKMVVDAVAAIPNLNFAGVDVMKLQTTDEKGNKVINRYLIEANSNPGSQIIDITGINYFEKLLDFVEREHKHHSRTTALQSPISIADDPQGDVFMTEFNSCNGDTLKEMAVLKKWGY
ncbi:MAG: ATP-grasp domain-containing protein [Tenuifilaceae bacterium]|nr:ATP-grasp domain-containing protein [Tenuifilaceae bacterium]